MKIRTNQILMSMVAASVIDSQWDNALLRLQQPLEPPSLRWLAIAAVILFVFTMFNKGEER